MNNVFAFELDDFILVYLDDILVFSPNEATSEKYLLLTLDKICQHKLCAKCKKCTFGASYVEYHGHIINFR